MRLSDEIKEVFGRFGLNELKSKQYVNLLDNMGAYHFVIKILLTLQLFNR